MELTGGQSFKMAHMLIGSRSLDMGKMGRGIAIFRLGTVTPRALLHYLSSTWEASFRESRALEKSGFGFVPDPEISLLPPTGQCRNCCLAVVLGGGSQAFPDPQNSLLNSHPEWEFETPEH